MRANKQGASAAPIDLGNLEPLNSSSTKRAYGRWDRPSRKPPFFSPTRGPRLFMNRCLLGVVLPLGMLGCGASNDGGEAGGHPSQDGGQASGGATSQPCEYSMSQGLSQPCCLEYGIDACGAYLFCAAFDGRIQPTCYAEHSRLDQQACTADVQCASSSCNVEQDKCRSLPRTSCSVDVGCASFDGDDYFCHPRHLECWEVGTNEEGRLCSLGADQVCASGVCEGGTCFECDGGGCSEKYGACQQDSDCAVYNPGWECYGRCAAEVAAR
jgi:hypothetical protein